MEAIMSHVGNHDSRQSTALLYQFLRWNLSCNILWVRRNLLFKLGFLVPLRTDGFSCYNPTETRVREITRRRVKQIILSIYRLSFTEWSGWGKKEISAPLKSVQTHTKSWIQSILIILFLLWKHVQYTIVSGLGALAEFSNFSWIHHLNGTFYLGQNWSPWLKLSRCPIHYYQWSGRFSWIQQI